MWRHDGGTAGIAAVALLAGAVLTAGAELRAARSAGPDAPDAPGRRLLLVAARVGAAPGDGTAGVYSRIHLRRWVRAGDRYVQWDSPALAGRGRLRPPRRAPPRDGR